MVKSRHVRIAASGTVTVADSSVALKQIFIVVSDAGTTWIIKVQDRDGTPAVIVPPITIAAPSTLEWIYQHFKEPIPMVGGIDFVTISGTPGVIDLWYSFEQQSGG